MRYLRSSMLIVLVLGLLIACAPAAPSATGDEAAPVGCWFKGEDVPCDLQLKIVNERQDYLCALEIGRFYDDQQQIAPGAAAFFFVPPEEGRHALRVYDCFNQAVYGKYVIVKLEAETRILQVTPSILAVP